MTLSTSFSTARALVTACALLALPGAGALAEAGECSGTAQCDAACAQRVPQACTRAGKAWEGKKELARAAAAYQQGCGLGDGAACFQIGQWLLQGTGYPKDPARADPFFTRACELGLAPGCVEEGVSAESGRGGMVDLPRAAASYYRACQAQELRGCTLLGRLYLWGVGVEVDPSRAAAYFKIACDRKHGPGCFALASLTERGVGVPRNAKVAAALYKQAAALGEKEASLELPQVGPAGSAAITFTSAPPGAKLTIDGMRGGTTPVSLRLPAGEHLLRLETTGRPPVIRPFVVTPGRDEALDVPFPVKLEVATQPSGAQLFIDGREVGVSPWRGDQLPGPHQLEARLHGYEPKLVNARLEGARHQEKLVLARSPAQLRVESVPPGAQVEVDGKQVGITPWTGHQSAGPHQVKVRLPGYLAWSARPKLQNGEASTLTATLKQEEVALKVSSRPAGAKVTVDGRELGRTPYVGRITVAPHSLDVLLDGYQVVSERLELTPGAKAVQRALTLVAAPVALQVVSEPAGAEVRVDDQRVGLSPFRGTLPLGAHRVSLKLPGFEPQEQTVTAALGAPVELKFELVAQPVDVEINTEPGGALVTVDGAPRGAAPLKLQLPPGPHVVEASADGYADAKQPFTLQPGVPGRWALVLSARPVEVKLTSEPVGAAVTVNGLPRGVTPLTVALPPGPYHVSATLSEHVTQEAEFTLPLGAPSASWNLVLPPVPKPAPTPAPATAPNPPPAPALAVNEADLIAQLRRPDLAVEKKRALLKEAVASLDESAFGRALMAVEPAVQRGTLCPEFDWKAPTAVLRVVALDSYGDEVPSEITLDGKAVGSTPFFKPVPACTRRVEVVDAGGHSLRAAQDVRLVAGGSALVTTRYPGKPGVTGIHLVGEYTASERRWPGVKAATFGIRLDHFGRIFYFGIAAKGGYVLEGASPTLSLEGPKQFFPYPMVDLSAGLDGAFSFGNAVRLHVAPAIGTWHSVYPAARVVLGINVLDRVMVSGQAEMLWDTHNFTQFQPKDYALAFGAGLGFLLH